MSRFSMYYIMTIKTVTIDTQFLVMWVVDKNKLAVFPSLPIREIYWRYYTGHTFYTSWFCMILLS